MDRCGGALLHAALLCATLAASTQPARADTLPTRRTVCAISFNGSEEVDAFRAFLPPDEFDFVDLAPASVPGDAATPAVGPGTSGGAGRSWIFDACRPDVRCDVVIYAGEFAGGFFGTRPYSLGLRAMEEASCKPGCDGIFHHAQEVFLAACNTLATKAEDRRTPEEYLQVLLDHGFDRASAENVVEMRYGPLGASFRETVRRTFAGVPRVYGFASVAPKSVYTVPMFDGYLHATGDYARYLDAAEGRSDTNRELLRAFRGTALTQAAGLSADEPAASDRDAVCALYDDGRGVLERLRIARDVMSNDDFLAFVPTLDVFLDRHPPRDMDPAARAVFSQIQGVDAARQRLVALVRGLDVSIVKLQLAHFSVEMGWMTPGELRRIAIDGTRQLLAAPLTPEVSDVTCEITKQVNLGDEFGVDDLPSGIFSQPEGVRLVDCLHPADARVTPRLLVGLDGNDATLRTWAAYALARRLPLDDPTLAQLAAYVDDPLPDVRERVRWVFRAQGRLSDTVLATVRDHDPALAQALHADGARGRRSSGGWRALLASR